MMHERRARPSIALIVGILLLGCGEATDEAVPDASVPELPAGHVPIPEADLALGQRTPVTVLETMDSGGYTYARVEVEGEEAWLAGPRSPIAVGDSLVIFDALPMEGFTSPSLNRTFDLLYFVNSFLKPGAALALPAPSTTSGVQGTADEVLTGGGYTYVRVDVDGDAVWIAGPTAQVSEGQTVSWNGGTPMDGFKSSSLDRTFERILFVEGISVTP